MGLIGNLSLGETLMIAVVAVLVFGRRLPDVAAQAFAQVRKLRGMLDDVRRETGIDKEIRSLRQPFESVAREARVLDPGTEPRKPPRTVERPTSEAPGAETEEARPESE